MTKTIINADAFLESIGMTRKEWDAGTPAGIDKARKLKEQAENKYSVQIAFGEEAINRLRDGDRSSLRRFNFKTQGELNAFMYGISAVYGWDKMAVDGWV